MKITGNSLITAEELCQYQKEYESRVNEIEAQITELLYRRSLYEKDFHIDEGWEETVNKYLSKEETYKGTCGSVCIRNCILLITI